MVRIEVIERSAAGYRCASTASEDMPHLDLSYPWRKAPYDRNGSQLIIDAVKRNVLGARRVTKRTAEAFFEDAENFFRPSALV